MTDGVAVYEAVESGRDFVLREHNRAGELITGLARTCVVGRRVTEAFPQVEASGLLDVFRRVWRTGEAESYPTSLYRDVRISLWVENYVFKLPSGEIAAVYSDKTKRKQSEEALHSSYERLRLLAARIEAAREEERTMIARERDTAVYRILQDALTNVAIHAQASRIRVSLQAIGDTLALIVADEGRGIRDEDIESVTSMGLIGMRERAAALGGQLDISSRSDGGTRVLLRVPRS